MAWRGSTVLIVGDSQAAGFPGQQLEQALVAMGVREVRTVAVEGRGARGWAQSANVGLLEARLREVQPTHVIYLFGINDTPGIKFYEAVGLLKGLAGRAETWWVGPPSYPDEGHNAQASALAAQVKQWFGAKFIDSQRIVGRSTVGRTADGAHFTRECATLWVTGITVKLQSTPTSKIWWAVGGCAAIVALGIVYYRSRR